MRLVRCRCFSIDVKVKQCITNNWVFLAIEPDTLPPNSKILLGKTKQNTEASLIHNELNSKLDFAFFYEEESRMHLLKSNTHERTQRNAKCLILSFLFSLSHSDIGLRAACLSKAFQYHLSWIPRACFYCVSLLK